MQWGLQCSCVPMLGPPHPPPPNTHAPARGRHKIPLHHSCAAPPALLRYAAVPPPQRGAHQQVLVLLLLDVGKVGVVKLEPLQQRQQGNGPLDGPEQACRCHPARLLHMPTLQHTNTALTPAPPPPSPVSAQQCGPPVPTSTVQLEPLAPPPHCPMPHTAWPPQPPPPRSSWSRRARQGRPWCTWWRPCQSLHVVSGWVGEWVVVGACCV